MNVMGSRVQSVWKLRIRIPRRWVCETRRPVKLFLFEEPHRGDNKVYAMQFAIGTSRVQEGEKSAKVLQEASLYKVPLREEYVTHTRG